MRTVIIPLLSADLSEAMTAMRSWLDSHQVEPSFFRYDDLGGGELLMKVDFAAAREAEAFAAAFEVRKRNGAAEEWRRLRHSAAVASARRGWRGCRWNGSKTPSALGA